jgi:hypothetical protein
MVDYNTLAASLLVVSTATFLCATAGSGRNQGPPLFDFHDEHIADHNLGKSFRELQYIVPNPFSGGLIRGECLVRAVEHADGDEHARPTIEQVITAETLDLAQ